MESSFATPALWAGFVAFVLLMLALDLFVLATCTLPPPLRWKKSCLTRRSARA